MNTKEIRDERPVQGYSRKEESRPANKEDLDQAPSDGFGDQYSK